MKTIDGYKLHCEDCQHCRYCPDCNKVDATQCRHYIQDEGPEDDLPDIGIKYVKRK